jgi:hypothetical protein
MPSAVVKSFAKKSGKSVETVENYWNEAKAEARKEKKSGNIYPYVVGILKRRLGISSSMEEDIIESASARLEEASLKLGGKSYKSIYDIPDLWVMSIVSSTIDEAAYDVKTNTMLVNFKSGSIMQWYAYSNVPIKVWVDFTKAESKGSFFAKKIKEEYESVKFG